MRHLTAALALAICAASASAQDIIRFKDPNRPPIKGEIIKATHKIVEYEIASGSGSGSKTSSPSREVAEIIVQDANRKGFMAAAGESAMERGEYDKAIERFQSSKQDPNTVDIVRQLVAINLVRCHYYKGDYKAALTSIQTLRRERPNSFFLKESYEIEFKCHAATGDTAGLTRSISEFEKAGKAERDLEDWAKSADLMRATLFEMQKDWRKAMAIHRKYARDKYVGEEASLGEMRCLTALKDWGQLKIKADVILGKKNATNRMRTAAHNAQGELLLNEGKPKEALLNFMRGVAVLYRGQTSQEHATALARAAVACARIASSTKDAERKGTYAGRAHELLRELTKNYGGKSSLAREAKQAIDSIKK